MSRVGRAGRVSLLRGDGGDDDYELDECWLLDIRVFGLLGRI